MKCCQERLNIKIKKYKQVNRIRGIWFSCLPIQFQCTLTQSEWITNALPIYMEHDATYQPSEGHANKLKGSMKIIELKKIHWEITHLLFY